MNGEVTIEHLGPVTVVTLDRPGVRNAVDAATAQALYEAFLAFDADDSARVAVFHGAHGHFCAGWDLQAGAKLAGSSLERLDFEAADEQPPGPMGPSLLVLSKPVIAAVSGAAVAGGMELALWCDMRVMEEDAYFGVYCRRFGVPLIDGGTVRLPRLIGQSRALDMILTGREVGAREAFDWGLANRLVPEGQALAEAKKLAELLIRFPQACLRSDRRSAYEQWDLEFGDALENEARRGAPALEAESRKGAARFAAGKGRGGDFGDI